MQDKTSQSNDHKQIKPFSENDLIFSKFRISLEGGFAYWTYKIPSGMEDRIVTYAKELKYGMDLAGDFCVYFSPSYGVGIKFSNFFTKNTLDNVPVYNSSDSIIGIGKLRQQIRIRYIGPVLTWRNFAMDNKLIFSGSLSGGWIAYEEDLEHIYSFFYNGSDVGLNVTLGVEYMVGSNATLGITGGYTYGKLGEMKIDGFKSPLQNDYDISHFILNVALRIYK